MEAKVKVSGFVFLIISVLQFVRFFGGWEIMANGHVIPVGLSAVAGTFFLVLAFWNLKGACCKK